MRAWLGIGTVAECSHQAFPDFEQIRRVVSRRGAQFETRNPVLYPAELRGHTFSFLTEGMGRRQALPKTQGLG
jgi:hypothetical protein